MTLGWIEIVVDGQPAMVRICYVRAWQDPAWRKANNLPARRRPGRRGESHAPTDPREAP